MLEWDKEEEKHPVARDIFFGLLFLWSHKFKNLLNGYLQASRMSHWITGEEGLS
jgi:hypothetical protein